jgi:molecular chaperone GrpE (heat shock protein)
MRKGNGKTDVNIDLRDERPRDERPRDTELRGRDLEHELPPADGREDAPAASAAKTVEIGGSSERELELEKLRAERDTLLDRLARLQAEFDNARKRAVSSPPPTSLRTFCQFSIVSSGR